MLVRRIIRMLLCMAAVPSLSDPPAHAQERAYLSKTVIEQTDSYAPRCTDRGRDPLRAVTPGRPRASS